MSAEITDAVFHLAFPVHDLEAARAFYVGILGCIEGRSADRWIDFNLYGHQIVAHLTHALSVPITANPVDGHDIPVPHFGVIMSPATWHTLVKRVRQAGVSFMVEPGIRFRDQPGEQATMLFRDPSGNVLEFKSFSGYEQIFSRDIGKCGDALDSAPMEGL